VIDSVKATRLVKFMVCVEWIWMIGMVKWMVERWGGVRYIEERG
jgi:hypothetical protein